MAQPHLSIVWAIRSLLALFPCLPSQYIHLRSPPLLISVILQYSFPSLNCRSHIYADNFHSTRYGWHDDYLFGWKSDVLQQALDARCNIHRCPRVLETQSAEDANKCTKSQHAREPTEGCMSHHGPPSKDPQLLSSPHYVEELNFRCAVS
jgi:hypothetical protein